MTVDNGDLASKQHPFSNSQKGTIILNVNVSDIKILVKDRRPILIRARSPSHAFS